MRTRNTQPVVRTAAAPTVTVSSSQDRSQGIPAVIGITFSFGMATSFTVLECQARSFKAP